MSVTCVRSKQGFLCLGADRNTLCSAYPSFLHNGSENKQTESTNKMPPLILFAPEFGRFSRVLQAVLDAHGKERARSAQRTKGTMNTRCDFPFSFLAFLIFVFILQRY